MLRVIAGRGQDVIPGVWDPMNPQFLQNASPAGQEFHHRAVQPAQPTSQFFSIGAGELEGWTIRFLASLADTPGWEDTVSLVNEHHQTLAHLAVLFRYTALLKQVAQWGIDVDVQDVNGFTALHCAYLCGDLDSVWVLKGYGADEDIQDNLGRRPLDMHIPSTNDLGRGSPSSDCTSSSIQGPNDSEEDWERVSMAPSQPDSLSNHGPTIDLPVSRHQPLQASVIPASLSVASPAGSNSFLTDDGEIIQGVSELGLSDSPISLEHDPSSPHAPDGTVATFQYARSQEQELKELKKTSNESNFQNNQDMQSPSSLQETIFNPRRNSPSEGGDRDSPGEYERCENDSIDPIYNIKLFSADPTPQCFRHYPVPEASVLPSLSIALDEEGGIAWEGESQSSVSLLTSTEIHISFR